MAGSAAQLRVQPGGHMPMGGSREFLKAALRHKLHADVRVQGQTPHSAHVPLASRSS